MPEMPPALARSNVDRRQVSRELRRAERREAVLERMTAVFAKRGYQAATVDHLIAGGKISMGNFYKEFEGKEDVFVAIYDRVIEELGERLSEVVSAGADWPSQVVAGLRTVVEYCAEKPLAAKVVLLEAQTGGEAALGRYTAMLHQVSDFLREGRVSSAAARDLPPSFEEASATGLAWLLQSRLARDPITDAEELWPRMAKMVLEPYLGTGEAAKVIRSFT